MHKYCQYVFKVKIDLEIKFLSQILKKKYNKKLNKI